MSIHVIAGPIPLVCMSASVHASGVCVCVCVDALHGSHLHLCMNV